MCGITILISKDAPESIFLKALQTLTSRGPDSTTIHNVTMNNSIQLQIGFSRLRIQGSPTPDQPFVIQNGSKIVVCNGEIFNSTQIIKSFDLIIPQTASDCAVLPALLDRGLTLSEIALQLDGDFAIVVIDTIHGTIEMCRDPYGVRPLFYNDTSIASELKGLIGESQAKFVEPGTVLTRVYQDVERFTDSTVRWHHIPWLKCSLGGGFILRNELIQSVHKRLTTVRDIGACLSGGLDSSLVAAIAAKELRKYDKVLHTYSIGIADSPDLLFARQVAEYIKSIHHERIVTSEECLAVIPAVVRAIESFDITTVRASVGNYLLGQFIATVTPTVKVVLNGDGADEVFGGYLYMRAAPNEAAFELETTRLLTDIHRYDVLRSERCMSAHGLESRSPFLDRQFVAIARSVPTLQLRPGVQRIEKYALRDSFRDAFILPETVLWRRKEAFSDGISKQGKGESWFEMARAEGERQFPNEQWRARAMLYDVNTPQTAEALWYRELFHQHYPMSAAVVAAPVMWMPRWVGASDPSARTLTELYDV